MSNASLNTRVMPCIDLLENCCAEMTCTEYLMGIMQCLLICGHTFEVVLSTMLLWKTSWNMVPPWRNIGLLKPLIQ